MHEYLHINVKEQDGIYTLRRQPRPSLLKHESSTAEISLATRSCHWNAQDSSNDLAEHGIFFCARFPPLKKVPNVHTTVATVYITFQLCVAGATFLGLWPFFEAAGFFCFQLLCVWLILFRLVHKACHSSTVAVPKKRKKRNAKMKLGSTRTQHKIVEHQSCQSSKALHHRMWRNKHIRHNISGLRTFLFGVRTPSCKCQFFRVNAKFVKINWRPRSVHELVTALRRCSVSLW